MSRACTTSHRACIVRDKTVPLPGDVMLPLRRSLFLLALLSLSLAACSDEQPESNQDVADVGGDGVDDVDEDDHQDIIEEDDIFEVPEGTAMRFAPNGSDFFDLPFPCDARSVEGFDGLFSAWPGSQDQRLLRLWFDAADDLLEGWSPISGLFAYFTAPLDATTLPADAAASVNFDDGPPALFLIDVDVDSPARGEILPITCQFRETTGTYHDAHQVGCISPLGVVRRPATRYALVITDALLDEEGDPVVPDEAMARLLAGQEIAGPGGELITSTPYQQALEVLDEAGVSADAVSSLVLFTTMDPSARLRRINQWYDARPTPTIDDEIGLSVHEVYDDYVVVKGHYDVPVIQEGERPYAQAPSGRILFDDQGDPVLVEEQSIRFYLTIPRRPMPAAGYPAMIYLHGSGGIAEQLMTRGAQGPEGEAPQPGTGPAGVVAPYGVAGFAADFGLHGMRHDPPDSLGLLLYNLLDNPRAAVDNFIIAANEVTLHARLIDHLEFDISDVEGLAEHLDDAPETVRFNGDAIAIFGQSMGSTIGLPAMTVDSTIDAGIFSGSGGVLIEVALASTEPVNIGQVLHGLLGYRSDEVLDHYDPLLSAVQHVWDLVDPVVHARHLFDELHPGVAPGHALQHSGIDDSYFSPASRAAFSTALGAQIVEPVVEPIALEAMAWRGLDDTLTPPVSANRDGTTAVVTQYEPSVLDGHHVAFQRDDAKAQYGCFLRSLAQEAAPVLRSVDNSSIESCLPD